MKYHKLFFVLLLICSNSFGQINIKGIISDSLEIPLQSASIVAINKASNALETYALSDEKGFYKLSLKESTAYKIQVSSLGLITINDLIETSKEDITKNYTLRADIVLDEVIVKLPIEVRGDTLIYNADSFKSGSERK